jgi:hypothetical protein
MTGHRTMRGWGATLAMAATLGLAMFLWLGAADARAATAHAARTINAVERAQLHLVSKSGSALLEKGTASGSLPGNVTAQFTVTLVRVTGLVTIYPRGGSITIRVVGSARSAGINATFGGTMSVAGGTGRYAHARGRGTFSGTVNRRSWAATVTARGRVSY